MGRVSSDPQLLIHAPPHCSCVSRTQVPNNLSEKITGPYGRRRALRQPCVPFRSSASLTLCHTLSENSEHCMFSQGTLAPLQLM